MVYTKIMKVRSACLILIFTLVGCGGGDEEDANYIPALEIECPSGSIAACGSGGATVYGAIHDDPSINCDTTLKGLDASSRRLTFVVTGQATSTTSGAYLTASITAWKNSSNGTASSLDSGSYRGCAFIDANSNDRLDSGEPVAGGDLSPGTARVRLTSWSTAL